MTYNEAIILIENNEINKDFEGWDLSDWKGWSVAHEAVFWGNLPKYFDKWEIKDKKGKTVYEVAKERGTLAKEVEKRYEKEKSKGLSY